MLGLSGAHQAPYRRGGWVWGISFLDRESAFGDDREALALRLRCREPLLQTPQGRSGGSQSSFGEAVAQLPLLVAPLLSLRLAIDGRIEVEVSPLDRQQGIRLSGPR